MDKAKVQAAEKFYGRLKVKSKNDQVVPITGPSCKSFADSTSSPAEYSFLTEKHCGEGCRLNRRITGKAELSGICFCLKPSIGSPSSTIFSLPLYAMFLSSTKSQDFSSGEILHRLLPPVQPQAEQSVPGFLFCFFPPWLYHNELFKGTASCFLLHQTTKNCPEILSSPFEFLSLPPRSTGSNWMFS